MARVFNFSAGPAALPEEVLQQAATEMMDWHGSGSSVMEMSHRGSVQIVEGIQAVEMADGDIADGQCGHFVLRYQRIGRQ